MLVDTTKVNPKILKIVQQYIPFPKKEESKEPNFSFDKKVILYKNTK